MPSDDSKIDGAALSQQGRYPFCRYQIHILEEGIAAIIKAAVIKTDLRRACPRDPYGR